MYIEMTIHNKEIQLNIESLEVEICTDAAGGIENITVDGQEPSECELIVIRDNMHKIQSEVAYQWMENERNKDQVF